MYLRENDDVSNANYASFGNRSGTGQRYSSYGNNSGLRTNLGTIADRNATRSLGRSEEDEGETEEEILEDEDSFLYSGVNRTSERYRNLRLSGPRNKTTSNPTIYGSENDYYQTEDEPNENIASTRRNSGQKGSYDSNRTSASTSKIDNSEENEAGLTSADQETGTRESYNYSNQRNEKPAPNSYETNNQLSRGNKASSTSQNSENAQEDVNYLDLESGVGRISREIKSDSARSPSNMNRNNNSYCGSGVPCDTNSGSSRNSSIGEIASRAFNKDKKNNIK